MLLTVLPASALAALLSCGATPPVSPRAQPGLERTPVVRMRCPPFVRATGTPICNASRLS